MPKTILITGATDGIGREAAHRLSAEGHHLLLHGRSAQKLAAVAEELGRISGAGPVEIYRADMSRLSEVAAFADKVATQNKCIDVLINNAGVFHADASITDAGLDIRFVVNTLAPALLTRRLLPLIPADGRIVHLSSAAQAPVDLDALAGKRRLEPSAAYAQSKLALTIWSQALAKELGINRPVTVAVNPGSLLATKMVKEGYGIVGNDIGIGADILVRAATTEEFAGASGRYFDNDAGRFAPPHADASDPVKVTTVVQAIEMAITDGMEGNPHD